MDIPRQMGRSGAESIDDLFFTLLLKNTGFFSRLTPTCCKAPKPSSVRVAHRCQDHLPQTEGRPSNKAKDQKPINIRPEFLVVPSRLKPMRNCSWALRIDDRCPRNADQDSGRQPSPKQVSRHFQRRTCRTVTTREPAARLGICSPIQMYCLRLRSCSLTVDARRYRAR